MCSSAARRMTVDPEASRYVRVREAHGATAEHVGCLCGGDCYGVALPNGDVVLACASCGWVELVMRHPPGPREVPPCAPSCDDAPT